MKDTEKNMIQKTDYTHISGSDSLSLSVLRIEPERAEDIKGIIQLVHGMCEYKERYEDFMNYLAENGFLCVIHDHRGHGHSVKDEKDLGFMYEAGFEALFEDAHEITAEIKAYAKERTGRDDLPFVLFGHSMGSLIVRCYLQKYDGEIDKLIVMGCPSESGGMKAGHTLIKILKGLKGERAHSKLIDSLVSGDFEKAFKEENTLHAWVNSDPAMVAKYNADPYCNYTFTLNGYLRLVEITMMTYLSDDYAMKNPALPVLFLSGEKDPCAKSEEDLKKAVNKLKNHGYTDVSYKMYPGMRHEILNEPRRAEVYADVLEFANGN